MNCEQFESVMIDELYGELDEVTSTDVRRHLSGCPRCTALLAGLRATRRVAVLPMVAPPADLEAKVLSATWAAQKVVPLRSRISRGFAWAGVFAMRPQTAMAAVFLLMIGSGALLLQSQRSVEVATGSAYNAFQGGGYPAAAPEEAEQGRGRVDLASAASAHGPAMDRPGSATVGLGAQQGAQAQAPAGGVGAVAEKDKLEDLRERGATDEERSKTRSATNASPPAGAPAATATAGAAPHSRAEGKGAAPDFDRGLQSYRDGQYGDATKKLDSLAGSDPNAALWAARSVRDGEGCAAAVPRFDALSTRQWGTTVGYEATMDAGRCYRGLGRPDLARARFASLLAVPGYMAKAQDALDNMTPKAAAKPMPRATSTGN